MGNAGGFALRDGVLKKYRGPGGDVVIPNGVTGIGDEAFSGCNSLTGIAIPDSVTSIGARAFSGTSLTSIVIPNGITNIGDHAFSNCHSLTSIAIPDSVTSIGNGAFESCDRLTSISIPDSVTDIGNSAFSGCGSLTSITIPDSITSIGNKAFSGCNNLTGITIPDGVTNVCDGAFANCKMLSTFVVKNRSCKFGSRVFGDAIPSGLLPHIGELFVHFSDGDLKAYVLNEQAWNTLHVDVQAAIFMARQGKTLLPLYAERVRDSEKLGNALLGHLSEKPSARECKAIANFMTMFSANVTAELLARMYETLKPLKTAAKALEEIENAPALRNLLKL